MPTLTHYQDAPHREQVIALWNATLNYSSAHNLPAVTIDAKLAVRDKLFFVALKNDTVVGTVMAGYDGHRGWLYSVATHPAHQGQGIGRKLVHHAEQALRALGCPKINLQVMGHNEGVVGFYEALGYVVEPRVSLGKRLL